MSAESFETTSWGWQISQWQTEVGEWFEYHFSRWLLRSFNNLPNFSLSPWVENILKLLFWILLCLFLAWVGWQLWQKFSPYVYSRLSTVNNTTNANVRQPENISVTGWWERSQEFYRQGNCRDACRCLYLGILQYLHDNQVIPKKSSRTDGEYLQLLQLSATTIQPYETLITTHEQLCFSDREMSSDNYQQCQQAFGEITEQ
ncbi:MAG: DUF4129 domain-containing protein [Calothrix sp. MO_167.B12]|nr:DUF4129 domain-containing protein [Calothrix sp. MO_167.B12]